MSVFSKLKEIKDLRHQAKTIQGLLADVMVEASAAWGKVKITMNGNQEVQTVSIEPELLKPEEKSNLEKAVKEAITEANKKAQKAMAEKVRAAGGINLPGLTK